MNNNEDRHLTTNRWFSSALLATIPAIGYAGAYLFEAGYLRSYEIDYSLARITPSSITFSIITILLCLSFLWLIGFTILNFKIPLSKKYKRRAEGIRLMMLAVFVLSVSICIFFASYDSVFGIIGVIFLSISIFFIVGISIVGGHYALKRNESFLTALSTAFPSRESDSQQKPLHTIEWIMISFLIMVTCFSVGRYYGDTVNNLGIYITGDEECRVIIRNYDGELLTKSYDTETDSYRDFISIDNVSNGMLIKYTQPSSSACNNW